MHTPVRELLGMDQSVVQAPIGTAAVPRLAAAVSNAGALGMVGLSWAADVSGVIGETSVLTGRPFGREEAKGVRFRRARGRDGTLEAASVRVRMARETCWGRSRHLSFWIKIGSTPINREA